MTTERQEERFGKRLLEWINEPIAPADCTREGEEPPCRACFDCGFTEGARSAGEGLRDIAAAIDEDAIWAAQQHALRAEKLRELDVQDLRRKVEELVEELRYTDYFDRAEASGEKDVLDAEPFLERLAGIFGEQTLPEADSPAGEVQAEGEGPRPEQDAAQLGGFGVGGEGVHQGAQNHCEQGKQDGGHSQGEDAGSVPRGYGSAVLRWAEGVFGPIALNRRERAIRLVEEAIEVAQAEGVSLSMVHRVASNCYTKDPGETAAEVGAVAMTLEALAANQGIDVAEEAAREFARCQLMDPAYFAERHRLKIAAGRAIAEG